MEVSGLVIVSSLGKVYGGKTKREFKGNESNFHQRQSAGQSLRRNWDLNWLGALRWKRGVTVKQHDSRGG